MDARDVDQIIDENVANQASTLFKFVHLHDEPPSFPPEATLDTHRECAKKLR